MSYLKKAWAWVIYSSQDPTKISLTIKAALVTVATMITMAMNLANVQIPGPEVITQTIDAIVAFVQMAFFFISAAVAAFGAIRKVWTSFSGDNAVVNAHPAFTGQDQMGDY